MVRFKKNQNALEIKLDEIKEGGYLLSCNKNKDWIKDIFSDIKNIDFTFIDDIRMKIEILRIERGIFTSGLINTTIKMCCIRCLDDFHFPLEVAFKYNLCPSDEKEFLPEVKINKEDLDLLYYQGDGIDISPLIREQILLNIPSYPLCRESCKGICPQCGSNLNHLPCQCDKKEVTNSKFEKLKYFHAKH